MDTVQENRNRLIEEYQALQAEQLRPAPKNPGNRHRHVEIVRKYQQKNGLLSPVSSLRPLGMKIVQHQEMAEKESKWEKKYSQTFRLSTLSPVGPILPPEETTTETRLIAERVQIINIKPVSRTGCRVFFDTIAQAFIDDATRRGKQMDIVEARSRADKRLIYLYGRKFRMSQVIRDIAKLREYPELQDMPLLKLLSYCKKNKSQEKKPETVAPTPLTEKAKARSIKLCEYIVIEPPQLIPHASLTAQNVIEPDQKFMELSQ